MLQITRNESVQICSNVQPIINPKSALSSLKPYSCSAYIRFITIRATREPVVLLKKQQCEIFSETDLSETWPMSCWKKAMRWSASHSRINETREEERSFHNGLNWWVSEQRGKKMLSWENCYCWTDQAVIVTGEHVFRGAQVNLLSIQKACSEDRLCRDVPILLGNEAHTCILVVLQIHPNLFLWIFGSLGFIE